MAKRYFVQQRGQQFGPYTGDQLKQMAANGQIATVDEVWEEGSTKKVPAHKVKGLFAADANVPAPLSHEQTVANSFAQTTPQQFYPAAYRSPVHELLHMLARSQQEQWTRDVAEGRISRQQCDYQNGILSTRFQQAEQMLDEWLARLATAPAPQLPPAAAWPIYAAGYSAMVAPPFNAPATPPPLPPATGQTNVFQYSPGVNRAVYGYVSGTHDVGFIAADTNSDGYVDAVGFDTNNDGHLDQVAADLNHDGMIDAVGIDTDSDGELDSASYDMDYDGDFDVDIDI